MISAVIKFYLLNLLLVLSLSADNNFIIYENEMPEEMKNLALTTTQLEINKKHDTNTIAKKLVNTFNNEYGKQWFTVIGTSGVTPLIRAKPKTLLQFSFNEIHVLLFKPAILSQSEMISESRRNNAKIKINVNEMNEVMKTNAQITATIAIKSYNNFHQISQNITNTFNEKYGQQWNSIVGEIGIESNAQHIVGTLISFSIGEIQIIIYQTTAEKSNVKTDIDYIKSARNAINDVKLIGSEMSEEMTNEVISVAKKTIMSVDNFGSLSKRISDHFVAKYGNVWVCSVADIMCTGLNDWVKGTFFAAKIGGLQVEIFQSKYSEKKKSDIDYIKSARSLINNVELTGSEMSQEMTNEVISVAKKTIMSVDNFGSLSKSISNYFVEKYGNVWVCTVADIMCTGINDWVKGTFVAVEIGGLQVELFQSKYSDQKKSEIDLIKSSRNALNDVKLIGSQMSQEMTNEVISVAKKTIMSVDNFGSLSKRISDHFVAKYGNVWVCSVADIMCTGLNDWVNGTFFAAKIGGLQIEIFQSKYSDQKKSEIDLVKSARNALNDVKLIGTEMNEEMKNEMIYIAKETIKTKDTFGSISKAISNHFVAKYGNVWVCSVADMMVTGLNDWVKGTFFAAKVGGLQIEIFQSKYSDQKTSSISNFSEVIKKAKSSDVKINAETLSESDKTNLLTIASNSLKQDFSDCDKNPENWYDPYGQCYRKIGEFIVKELGGYLEHGWCVTVGETNSHWNYCTSSQKDLSVFFQFNYGDLHFNIIKYKLQTS